LNLRTYIEQNRGTITNYGARYREGKRIASTPAAASVNNLVARRVVKKQQMRWSERGAYLLLQVRVDLPRVFHPAATGAGSWSAP
jgi:hypothetical protein